MGGRSVFLGGIGLVSLDSQSTYLPASPLPPQAASGPDGLTGGPREDEGWAPGTCKAREGMPGGWPGKVGSSEAVRLSRIWNQS